MSEAESSSANSSLYGEIRALRLELNRFRSEVTMNKTNSLLDEFKNQCAGDVIDGSLDNTLKMIKNESNDCLMWEHCEPVFTAYFENLAHYAKDGELSDDTISLVQNKIETMKESLSESDQCSHCLQQVETCFGQQIELLKKMGFYQPDKSGHLQVQDLPEEQISSLMGDALSSTARIQILKALYDEEKSFTALSKLTTLRGGNLLFHLDKLQNKGLIRQREERGEYQITLQGHNLLNSLLQVVKVLNIDMNNSS